MGPNFKGESMRIVGLIFVLMSASVSWAETGLVADVKLTPAGSFSAKTKDVTGYAVVKGDDVSAEKIVAQLKDLKTGLALRDKHATEKYLEVGKFPEATLISATGKNGKGKGKIRLRGIEKEVEGTYKIVGNELQATFPIKISEFGITGVKYMGVGVNDQVVVHVNVPIKK